MPLRVMVPLPRCAVEEKLLLTRETGEGDRPASAGWWRGRKGSLDYALRHVVWIAQDVARGNPQDAIAQTGQIGVATGVPRQTIEFGVFSAIYFDHQSRRRAVEVGDIRADRVLSAERRTILA